MYVVIPHVGKSHLTYRLIQSIPEAHKVILVDGSYVQDMGILAFNRPEQITYIPTGGVPHCLGKNWNLGAAHVPKSEKFWLFCATDIEFAPGSWNNINIEENLYPDCGIIKDRSTNWNLWLVRRWAWDLLKPMDEGYIPCAGEDDDLNMKCWATKIPIRSGSFHVATLEGGHASRLDIHRPGLNSDKSIRPVVVGHFKRKWGLLPSVRADKEYASRKAETTIGGKRRQDRPANGTYTIPTKRGDYGPHDVAWPDPLKLNLGCGRMRARGFVNIDLPNDGKINTRSDWPMDLAQDPWPWGPESVDRIESYHMIEHVSRADGEKIIRECFRVMKSGAEIVLECPDLLAACALIVPGNPSRIQHIYGNQKDAGQFHKWGYSRETLPALLGKVGFKVEEVVDGTDYHQKTEPCMRVVAVKP